MNLVTILGQNSFWKVNKQLAKQVGLNSAILYGILLSADEDSRMDNGLRGSEIEHYFELSEETVQWEANIKPSVQKTCIKNLVEQGLIKVSYVGVPKKRLFAVVDYPSNLTSNK